MSAPVKKIEVCPISYSLVGRKMKLSLAIFSQNDFQLSPEEYKKMISHICTMIEITVERFADPSHPANTVIDKTTLK